MTAAVLQLDLFEHSRDTMLRNDVLDALLRGDAAAAALARRSLAEAEPGHATLPALDGLIAALDESASAAPFADHAQAAAARTRLDQTVAPQARSQFGAAAADGWLAPLWRRLAERAAALPFAAAQADDHAAPLWLRAGDAASAAVAAQAVAAIASWRRIPAPLGWMAVARYRSEGLDAIWPLLAELAWLAPPRFALTARALADPLLNRLLRRYEDNVDTGAPDGSGSGSGSGSAADPMAWFPAWLLIDQPALLPRLREAASGQDSVPERVFRLMCELLGLERQGRHHELIAARKRLRDQQPALYAAYMASR